MKIRSKMLLVLFCAAVLPAIIIITTYQNRLSGILGQNYQKYVSSLSEESVLNVNEHFADIEKLLLNVRTQSSVIDYLKQVDADNYGEWQNRLMISQISEKLEFILNMYSDVEYINIIPLLEGVRIGKGYYSNTSKLCSDLDYVEKIVPTTEKVYCRSYFDKAKYKMYIFYAVSIIDGYQGSVIGYLSAVVDVTQYFSSIAYTDSDLGFIVSESSDNVIFRHKINLPEGWLRKINLCDFDSFRKEHIDGVDYTMVIREIVPLGWKMIFFADMDEIQRNLNDSLVFMIRLVLIFVLFAIGSVSYFQFKIYMPVQKLTFTMNSLSYRVPDIQVPVGKDEIAQLESAFNHLIERVNKQIIEIEEVERMKAEFEIKALQAQITPHFLYNTLNAIKCLAQMGKTEPISDMIEALIDLLRISAGKERLIPIGQEIEYVKAYASLMSLRSGYEIQVISKIESNVEAVHLPKLSLQPIVENSIIHGGVEEHGGQMVILISAFKAGNYIQIEIMDDGCGMTDEKLREINLGMPANEDKRDYLSRIGINNIRQRLELEYGDTAAIEIYRGENGGTVVRIKFLDKS